MTKPDRGRTTAAPDGTGPMLAQDHGLGVTETEIPSKIRWHILALVGLISMVTYLDRVNISIAARYIMDTHHLSAAEMGRVFSAFTLAYGLFQVPGGWLADRFGPRVVLAAAISWWSGFTALTAVATNIFPATLIPTLWSLIIVRFCLGMGEAAAFPAFTRTTANWMAVKDRAFAGSLPLAAAGLGATLTPPFIAWVMLAYGWEQAFYACALIGLLVAAVWFWYARDRIAEHPKVNQAELRLIQTDASPVPAGAERGRTPWRAILTEPNVWLLFATNFTCGYVIYIYLTWFYTYLLEARGLSVMRGSVYTMVPFFAITVMTPLGGVLCDWAGRRFGKTFGRRLVAMGGGVTAAVALFVGARLTNLNVAIIGLALGAGAVYFALSAHWVTTIDITREHAGTVSGIMNWGGNTGGMISPMLTPVLVWAWGWTAALEFAAVLVLAGSLLWLLIQPEKEISVAHQVHR